MMAFDIKQHQHAGNPKIVGYANQQSLLKYYIINCIIFNLICLFEFETLESLQDTRMIDDMMINLYVLFNYEYIC